MVTVTEVAAEKLRQVMDQKGLTASHALRVFVQGGGCGGMQYGMTFESNPREDDEISEQHGLRLVIDPTSQFYVDGAKIDYVDGVMGGGFHIENPNAVSGCGCGSSCCGDKATAGEESASHARH